MKKTVFLLVLIVAVGGLWADQNSFTSSMDQAIIAGEIAGARRDLRTAARRTNIDLASPAFSEEEQEAIYSQGYVCTSDGFYYVAGNSVDLPAFLDSLNLTEDALRLRHYKKSEVASLVSLSVSGVAMISGLMLYSVRDITGKDENPFEKDPLAACLELGGLAGMGGSLTWLLVVDLNPPEVPLFERLAALANKENRKMLTSVTR
jgi:hypothetical protein